MCASVRLEHERDEVGPLDTKEVSREGVRIIISHHKSLVPDSQTTRATNIHTFACTFAHICT